MTKTKVSFRNAGAHAQPAARSLRLESQGTERNYEQALKGVAEYLKEQRLGDLRHLDKEKAELYLEMRSQEIGQKALDLDRQAIQALIGQKLDVVKSEKEQILKSRAYTTTQTQIVASAQTERNALATLIAENAGLRAHELFTLLPAHQRPADTHRTYRADRFTSRENITLYTVEGKGGLCREVAIDNALAAKLEARRLDQAQQVYDRGIGYQQHYDLGGGQAWSSSFSKASNRELCWSNGAHGLRHQYAQQRMNSLQGAGYEYRQALTVVSEEMGHFRPDITEVYLR